jgi:biopolymer transport protein ExbD
MAVGVKNGTSDYDYTALTACAKRLKNQVPDAADETAATLTANKDIPYQVIIGTVDAIRKADDGQVLFPDINFGVPK